MSVQLSIIVPAYNAECYLEDCLNSILASTYRDFEILLIDDGSTDGTGGICDLFQQQHAEIKVYHTENRGLPSARNLGIDHAEGKYIGFVDADDLVAPDMFGSLVYAMDEDIQLGICRFQRCVRGSVPEVHEEEMAQMLELGQADTAALILKGSAGLYVWNKLYRRDVLNDYSVRFRPESQGAEDLFFNAEYLQYCNKVAFLEKELYFYITTEGSITSTFRSSRVVSDRYMSLPRASRYASEVLSEISREISIEYRIRAAMYYQTVLRKLKSPSQEYVHEAIEYVNTHKSCLLRHPWAWKYYCSALILCVDYRLWERVFRRALLQKE